MPKYKNIRIKMKNGKTRLQRVQVLKNGKYKYVKNVKSKNTVKNTKSKNTVKNKKKKVKKMKNTFELGIGRRKAIGIGEAVGILGAVDNFVNLHNTPLRFLNPIASAANSALIEAGLPGSNSKLGRALWLLGGTQAAKKTAQKSGINPYVKIFGIKLEMI